MPEMGGQQYTMWMAGGAPVGGLITLPEEARSMGAPPHWMASIGTPDVDAAVKMVKEMGGQVYMPPMDVPKVGRVAVVADPQGGQLVTGARSARARMLRCQCRHPCNPETEARRSLCRSF